MASISGCNVYLPIWRLRRDEIAKATGLPSLGGEKSVAHWDEDSITMAVEAARVFKGNFDALLFASTSAPFKIKQGSSLIASALDLENVFTVDVSGSLRASTNALIIANELVDSGRFSRVLVVASDRISVKPGSVYEQYYGDAAVALTIEKEGKAKIMGYSFYSQPLPGIWMLKDEVASFDIRLDGIEYVKAFQQSAMSLFKKLKMNPNDFDRIVCSAPDPRSYEHLMKSIDVRPEEIFFHEVGIAGTAHPFLLLASQLERPGRIILGGYGEGADMLAIEISEPFQTNLSRMLKSKKEISYYDYLYIESFLGSKEATDRPSLTKYWREEKSILRFYGIRCKNCGTVSYPISNGCVECGAHDNFEEVRLGFKGKIYTFTVDYLFSPGNYIGDGAHPQCVAVVDLEGGGRVLFEVTDLMKDFTRIECDAEVERTFRILFEKGGFRYYGWKVRLPR
jgi:3-hydroxy-3-methylglutaryl CoA synthase